MICLIFDLFSFNINSMYLMCIDYYWSFNTNRASWWASAGQLLGSVA